MGRLYKRRAIGGLREIGAFKSVEISPIVSVMVGHNRSQSGVSPKQETPCEINVTRARIFFVGTGFDCVYYVDK